MSNKKKPIGSLTPIMSPLLKGPDNLETGKQTVRRAGHYQDQKLIYNRQDADEQLSIWDNLSPDLQTKIGDGKREVVVKGIKLPPAEDKLMNCLLVLLSRHSNTRIDKENKPAEPEIFYKGNLPSEVMNYGGKETQTPMLRITPTELYKEYAGDDYSGKDIENIKSICLRLADKKFLITYKRHRWIPKGKVKEEKIDRIEEYLPLIKFINYYEGLTPTEDGQLDNNGGSENIEKTKAEIIVRFNPVITDQIDTKFINYYTDTDKRTEIASGGKHKVTTAIITLRDFLISKLSYKEYTVCVNKDTLPLMLGLDSYIKDRRRTVIKNKIKQAFEVVKALGLVLDIEEVIGKQYQKQYKFTLNKDF